MKKLFLSLFILFSAFISFSQTMQATLKEGSTNATFDIYLMPSASFSQKDEAATITIAVPASVSPAPSMGSSGVTANDTGPVTGITGLQPIILINNIESTSREVVVSTETVAGKSYYIYTFIFAGTATNNHVWVGGVEQLALSIQFDGCTDNCEVVPLLASLPNGGSGFISYFYYQPNTIGDITNYPAPFYANAETGTLVNGGSSDGSALSYVDLSTAVVLPVQLSYFKASENNCAAVLNWQSHQETNGEYYAIEKSLDGVVFKEINRINIVENSSSPKNYSYTDRTPGTGKNFYRLKMVDRDGKFSYSLVISLNLACNSKKVLVYPTLTTGKITVEMPQNFSDASIRILNIIGEEVLSDHSKTSFRYFDLSRFTKGMYAIQVIHQNKIIDNIKVVVK